MLIYVYVINMYKFGDKFQISKGEIMVGLLPR